MRTVLITLLLLMSSGCDLLGDADGSDAPPLDLVEEGGLGVAFNSMGNLRFAVPEDLYDNPFASYRATLQVRTARLPNQTPSQQTDLWKITCERTTSLPRSLDYGQLPDGCTESVPAVGVLPGRQMYASVVSAEVQSTGNTIRRVRDVTFQVNAPQSVVEVARSGDAVTFSWPGALVDEYGPVYEVAIHRMTDAGDGAAAYDSRIWRMICRVYTTPSPPLASMTSLTPGPGPDGPASECFVGSFTAPEFEPGRYVVFLRLRKELLGSQAGFASAFDWN